jgi:hypothetical protein
MKRSLLVLLVLLLASSALFSAPWLGGYRLSFDGYQDRAGQYYGVHLHFEPLWGKTFGLGLSIGGATSFGLSDPSSLFETSIEIRALDVEHMLFRRPSTWRQFDPFVFFFGEKTIKVLGLRFLDDRSWALRLLEITHYFF